MKANSAATAHPAERAMRQNSAKEKDTGNAPPVADEWRSCDSSHALCSATPVPAGAEVMESAASQLRSVVPARTESAAFDATADARQGVRQLGATDAEFGRDHPAAVISAMAADSPAEAALAPATLPSSPGALPSSNRASVSRETQSALVALTGISTETNYWFAWLILLALLLLLLLVWWWSRRGSQARAPSATPVASPATAQSALDHAAGGDGGSPGVASAPDTKDDTSVPAGAASVSMRRLTFAPIGAMDDATDREIALPRAERTLATPVKLQLVQSNAPRSHESVLSEAKRLLAAARPEDALRKLESVLGAAQPPQEAWIVAGWAWWRLAHENEGAVAFAQAGSAAESFSQALRQEPSRTDLMTRLARSHLLRAQHASSDGARKQSFDEALEYFDQRSQARPDEPADHLELAQAALQRANASEHEGADERREWLTRAQHYLSAIPTSHTLLQDGATKVLAIDVQLGLAAAAQGEASARMYRQAIMQMRTALADAAESSADVWLAKVINATRALITHETGGSRLLTLQSLKVEVAPHLQRTHAVTPLLAWINLLDEWSRLLPARAAQAKLAEADHLFERASQMNAQGPSGIQFARAYYLRTRSQHEQGANRLRTLQQAREILENIPADALPASIMKMETAEMELALARHGDGISAPEHYRHALMFATQAATASMRPLMAWLCAARALLGLSEHMQLNGEQHAQLLGLAGQLEEGGIGQPGALRTAAQIRLSAGEFASSSRLCEAAWNAGASRLDVLPLWQEADARWARTLEHANQDAGWRRLHQRLRLATTSY